MSNVHYLPNYEPPQEPPETPPMPLVTPLGWVVAILTFVAVFALLT